MYKTVFFNLFVLSLLFLTPKAANAATPTPIQSGPTPACVIIFGGGTIDCAKISQAVMQPTTAPAVPSNQNTQPAKQTQQPSSPDKIGVQSGQAMTKGGLPVHAPSQTKTTPATGPEAWSLISLLPMAGAGIWLRKRV